MNCFVRLLCPAPPNYKMNKSFFIYLRNQLSSNTFSCRFFLFVLNTLNPLLEQLPKFFLFWALSWEIWFSFQSINNPYFFMILNCFFWLQSDNFNASHLGRCHEAQFYWRHNAFLKQFHIHIIVRWIWNSKQRLVMPFASN